MLITGSCFFGEALSQVSFLSSRPLTKALARVAQGEAIGRAGYQMYGNKGRGSCAEFREWRLSKGAQMMSFTLDGAWHWTGTLFITWPLCPMDIPFVAGLSFRGKSLERERALGLGRPTIDTFSPVYQADHIDDSRIELRGEN
ncbi:hypothetical protein KM043_005396 [Ampulex compressa]|nr:hypothetical protein KM043_005396 [Ampulex compressa]